MQQMLNICTEFGVDYDVKFNDTKSVAMRVGPRFNVACKSLELDGKALRFVDCVKYLRVNILAWHHFKCSFEHVKLKFFRAFNCIYTKIKADGSEINTVELFKSYCLPHITYACEAIPFSKTDIHRLDNLIVRAVCRIFNVCSRENVDCLRRYFDLPRLGDIIERRKYRFIDQLIGLDHCNGVLRSMAYFTVSSAL